MTLALNPTDIGPADLLVGPAAHPAARGAPPGAPGGAPPGAAPIVPPLSRTIPRTRTRSGVRPLIRPLRVEDLPAVAAMADRCSTETLHKRFHGPTSTLPAAHLRQLVRGDGASGFVAEHDGLVVALASLHRVGRGAAELAVLVEDAWQHRGLGRRLLGHMAAVAEAEGMDRLVADVLRRQGFLVDALHRLGPEVRSDFDGPAVRMHLPVAVVAGPGRVPPRDPAA